MIWVLGVLCALALVALFFPFIFWVDFSADFSEITVRVRFFKKVVYTYTKCFKKGQSSEEEDVSVDEEDSVAAAPAPKVEKAEPPKSEQSVEPESKPETEKKKSSEEKSSDDEKEEKRSLTDEEFWTLLLTPEFDTRAWWAVRHALSALFKLFRIRFVDCFVEGIRFQEYENMGYAAALNGVLKSFPYIGAWDFRMDWTRDHEPHAEGHMRASINVCRVLGLILTTLFYGGIVAFTFWRRRAKILKTGELPELGFIRNKIVKMMSEDD